MQYVCDASNGSQNRTRTCSIEPDNNEESLNEVSPNACTLPSCHHRTDPGISISYNNLVVTLPTRPDSSKAIFRASIFASFTCHHQIHTTKVIS